MKRKIFLISLYFLVLIGCSQNLSRSKHVTIWHWMTDRHEAFQALADLYQQQTGVSIRFELYAPSDAYSQKVVAAAQARVLPDIYGILGEKRRFASFIQSGFVADLTEEFQENDGEWKANLFDKALEGNRFKDGNIFGIKPGIYGVPIDVMNIQMLYNKNLLGKAGIDRAPETMNEFLSAIQALSRIGISGFVSGWGEVWMVDCFALNYALNIMGKEKIMATYQGEIPYTDPDWIKVFDIFKTLTEHEAFIQGIVTKVNKAAEQDFALERSAFAFNGSWCVNVYHGMNPQLEYGVMLPPAINPNLPMKIWGAAGSSFVVNESSKNKEQAIAFLKWLTAKDQQVFLSIETKNLPANHLALSSIPEVLSQFAGAMDSTTHPSTWPYNEDPLVTEAFGKGIQEIIIGDKQPLQVAQEVQRIKERQLQREKQRTR